MVTTAASLVPAAPARVSDLREPPLPVGLNIQDMLGDLPQQLPAPRSQAGHQPHDTSKSLQQAIPVEHRAGCNPMFHRVGGPDRTGPAR